MTRIRLVQRKERKKLIIKRKKKPVKRKERSKLMNRRSWSNGRETRTPHEFVLALWVLPAWKETRWEEIRCFLLACCTLRWWLTTCTI